MQVAGIFIWWLLISILGFITIPIAFKIFSNLNDRGYHFTKPLGLLLVGLLSWLFGFYKFTNPTIIIAILLIAAISGWIFYNHRSELQAWMTNNIGLVLVSELFFLCLFLLFIFFRMHNADIVGTEKFMDLAFLNAITRSPSMPPYDPWLSGEGFYISYYYFGYLLMAILVKLSHIAPAIGFNLSLSMLYALSGIAVFGLLFNLVKRIRIAIAGWALIYLIGNLDGFRQVLETKSIANFNWWTPSRVIPDTINEFPFFSYLLGDMHPHMLAVPFVMIALAFGLNHLKSKATAILPTTWEQGLQYGLWGLVIGSLGFINSWDMPSLLLIAGLSLFFQQYREQSGFSLKTWGHIAGALGVILVVAIVPYIPFYSHFHSQASGIALTTQNTKVADFFLIFGPYIVVIITFLAVRYYAWFVAVLHPEKTKKEKPSTQKKVTYCAQCGSKLREGKVICGQCGHRGREMTTLQTESPLSRGTTELPPMAKQMFLFLLQPVVYWKQNSSKKAAWIIIGSLGFILGMMMLKAGTYGQTNTHPVPMMMAVTLLLLLAVGILLMTRIETPETVFTYCMLATAFLLLFGCEFLHINDTFQPPLDRMNTVFKFYYLSWFLLGLSAVVGLTWSMQHSFKNHNIKFGWMISLALLVLGSLVYPYAGTMIKTGGFNNPTTLDGSVYLNHSFAPDRDAIEWLRQHVEGNPVVLEATGGEYTDFARVSSFTGLPTVLGWGGHELQWRGNYDEPGKRVPMIEEIYSTYNSDKAKQLLNQYNVEFVFVGTLEKQKYATEALNKFSRFMKSVYKNDGVVIYQRQ